MFAHRVTVLGSTRNAAATSAGVRSLGALKGDGVTGGLLGGGSDGAEDGVEVGEQPVDAEQLVESAGRHVVAAD